MLLAERAGWPDGLDWLGILYVTLFIFGAPVLGYVLMVLDYRAYVRSLRRALVVVRGYATTLPDWVRRDAPPCLAALGLHLPCTKEEVLAAYREKVKCMHPDLGGSRRDFAKLQQHFEQAMQLVEDNR